MAAQVWTQVVREPIVKEADTPAEGQGLNADLGICSNTSGGSVV